MPDPFTAAGNPGYRGPGQSDKLVFAGLRKMLSLRTSPLNWCGNLPDLPASPCNPDSSENRGKTGVFYYSIMKIRGIATAVCALPRNDILLFWCAMTCLISIFQIPIYLSAG